MRLIRCTRDNHGAGAMELDGRTGNFSGCKPGAGKPYLFKNGRQDLESYKSKKVERGEKQEQKQVVGWIMRLMEQQRTTGDIWKAMESLGFLANRFGRPAGCASRPPARKPQVKSLGPASSASSFFLCADLLSVLCSLIHT